MSNISYEWKVDFAIIVSFFNLLLIALVSLLQSLGKRRGERIRAYETVYQDASFILEYPFRVRETLAKQRLYCNDDPDLQDAVRRYMDLHWTRRTWGNSKIIPAHIKVHDERFRFLNRVMDEARKFNDQLFSYRIGVSLAERSPVYYVDQPEVTQRLARVMEHVGRNLSLFSENIRRSWELAKLEDADEVKNKYEQCLRVCPDFFEHNRRDFHDPFYDLLEGIRQGYRALTRRRFDSLRWFLRQFRWKIRHPALYLRPRNKHVSTGSAGTVKATLERR